MNTDSLSFAVNAVTNIFATLNKKHYKSQFTQLEKFISCFGFECERQLYRCLLIAITSNADAQRSSLLQQLFADLELFCRPNWNTLLSVALKGVSTVNVLDIVKSLKLNDAQRAALLVALSEQTKSNPLSADHLQDIAHKCSFETTNDLTHTIISQTFADNRPLSQLFIKNCKLNDKTSDSAYLLHLPFNDDLTLSPKMDGIASSAANLTDDQIASMIVNESGVLSAEFIEQFNVTPKLCGKILCALCESTQIRSADNTQLTRCEEVDTFADICREILSSASPLTEIIQVIDCEAFIVNSNRMFGKQHAKVNICFQRFWQFCVNLCTTDKQGLYVLGSTFFIKTWNQNLEFQFGFIVQCIKNHFVTKLLSNSPSGVGGGPNELIDTIVPHLDLLKCQPDFDSSSELSSWKYQRFYQVLIDFCNVNVNSSLSSVFYSQVMELFKWPLQQCPDLVALGLLGCNNGASVSKNELMSLAIPSFLGNHPNAAIILHTLWNSNELSTTNSSGNWAKQMLLQGMCEYYMKSPAEEQQQRLSRILDVAQDLKSLSILLNGNCHPFVIDLACLASRREYLKLDKWLMDKIESNGESFINACIVFLNRRCAALLGGPNVIESSTSLVPNLPAETLATMLACLQQSITLPSNAQSNGTMNGSGISQELQETILTMVANSTRLLSKLPRQPPPGVIPSTTAQRPAVPLQTPTSIGDLGIGNLTLSGSNPETPQTPGFSSVVRPPFNALNIPTQQTASSISAAVGPQTTRDIRQVVGDLASIFPDMQQSVSIDIEEEADTYFQRIYNNQQPGSLSIDEVLDMLRRFQDSAQKREREVFTCMIRNLFKEYAFFPQYPDRELLITAQLFGGIIQMGLVKYMALVVALRYVLEALRKPLGSKMYYFGIAALDRFKTKLKDYPLYCQHLAQIPHFRDFPQHLIEYIESGTQSQEPPPRTQLLVSQQQSLGLPSNIGIALSTPSSTQMPQLSAMIRTSNMPLSDFQTAVGSSTSRIVQPPIASVNNVMSSISSVNASSTPITTAAGVQSPATNTRPSIANATNIDTLLAAGDTMYQIPPDSMQDKIGFIINNLSQINLTHKTDEFKEVIGNDEQYTGWIAQYFVMKRASIEPNFHTLYANFLDMLKMNELMRVVLKETHRNIKVLLRSDKEIANFSDRSLLKNLGHWLGMLTLAKSKPILAIDLDVKNLLIEAYHKGTQELLYVVPFLAKILESCAKSKVFKPPNPWTMGIIKALVELHQEPNLKLNLKFEVEVLCKALNLDINQWIGTSTTLKDKELFSKIDFQLGSGKSSQSVINTTVEQLVTPHHTPSPAPQLVQSHGMSSVPHSVVPTPTPTVLSPGIQLFNYHDINVNAITGLSQHIVISNNLPLLNMNPALKQFVRPAIERAVQEWIIPVVDRSMKICLTTAEQIIKKDFALDPDENRMCLAAHYLTRNLTAGMAMITCRDPLMVSITSALKAAFTAKCPGTSKDLIEITANAIAADNIDLACCFIQKTAIEKSLPELDRKLKSEYDIRRVARAEGRRYCDPSVLTYQAERMPESIRLKVGPVTPQQMNVYEELGKNIPGFNAPITDATSANLHLINPTQTASLNQFNKHPSSLAPLGIPSTSNAGGSTLASNFPINEAPPVPPQQADAQLITIYEKLMTELETLMHQLHQAMQPTIVIETIRSIAETLNMARQNPRDIVIALNLIQKVIEAIGELFITAEAVMVDMLLISRARDLYLVILKMLSDPRAFAAQWTSKQITRIALERLLNGNTPPSLPDELLETLIRAGLISFQMLDIHLAQLIDAPQNTLNPISLAFVLQFIKIYGHSESDFPMTVENLQRFSKGTNPSISNEIHQIIDVLRSNQTGPVGVVNDMQTGMLSMHTGNQSREFDADPPGLLEKTERLLREWIQLYHSQANTTKIFQFYVQQMNLQGILKTDDLITRFFRLSTEMCVELCYRILSVSNANIVEVRSKCFHTLDAFTHLIVMLVKHSGSSNAASGAASETTAKLNLLNKVLNIIAGVATQDQEVRQAEFQHLPYYRIFVLLFMELVLGPTNLGLPGSVLLQHNQLGLGLNPSQLDPLLESIQIQVLNAFCNTLHVLRPSKAPSFAFAWLDFISHRTFMEKCLSAGAANASAPTKGWQMYVGLLIDLIKFEAPFLRNVELPQSVDLLYKGTLKVFLVLLHDFPEFLCEYCYSLCDVIPSNAIQMRNLVLSAFPRNMRLPDPFTPNLKIDSLPEITQPPKGAATLAAFASNQGFKKDLDSYLRTRSPVTFLSDLRIHLQNNTINNGTSDSTHYNVQLMNALVLYVGQTAIQSLPPKSISMSSIAHSSHMDIFQNLAVALDTEGRYIFLNAIANQLRYPNSHTHYFSCTLLYLFAESNTEAIQEQITRILLERLIVNRPHPWGLLVTFIELIKNSSFKFWNHEFVRCAPEIEKLFESVARSCNSVPTYKATPSSGPSSAESNMISQTNQIP